MHRVSSVLRLSGLSKPPPFSKPEAQLRGTRVHRAVERLSTGRHSAEPIRIDGYVMGACKWYADYNPEVLGSEERLVDPIIGLTGRVDLFVRLFWKQVQWPIVVDVKTGALAPWHGPQTGGYELLASRHQRWQAEGPWERALLQLPGDGTYRWHCTLDPNDKWLRPTDRQTFLDALGVVRWLALHGEAAHDPAIPLDDVMESPDDHVDDAHPHSAA